MQHASLDLVSATPVARLLSTADYMRLLHPVDGWGKATLVMIHDAERATSRTLGLDILPFASEVVLDQSAYVSLNRYYGPRGRSRLAALNALYLDLDFFRLPQWQGRGPEQMARLLELSLMKLNIPQPSVVIDTGRGLAVLWLLEDLAPAAAPRWRACLRALIKLHLDFGADPACSDAARVFRVPGTTNRKANRPVRVLSGTLARHPFDDLADAIWAASGRPTRAELEHRRQKARDPQTPARPRGLPAVARFAQVLRDLERLREAWGGQVPEGLRNSWLHIFATALTHTTDAGEIGPRIEAVAGDATPGLPPSEVRALIMSALKKAEESRSVVPGQGGRYHYSGARLAEILGVSDDLARELNLEQIFSVAERARRKAARAKTGRAGKGAVSREVYLKEHATSRTQPWKAARVSRATWYRRQQFAVEASEDVGRGDGPGLNEAESQLREASEAPLETDAEAVNLGNGSGPQSIPCSAPVKTGPLPGSSKIEPAALISEIFWDPAWRPPAPARILRLLASSSPELTNLVSGGTEPSDMRRTP
ncbi:DNA-primase RepB domain-containing protein [Rubellimicrobium aerolatum]|uniref:DNA-primase RepB domain-containing protein n=1 Tax=Rubellimicrobium aerolatum TaxID=490979 RepID=A0ABW0S8R3_9RHOB|nr:DNA-primase RepB domain-containing protein [Rubellimicrobium aerolatum]MBP1804666.1 hypothetical protein [Rubellimicrobium aerolatum]